MGRAGYCYPGVFCWIVIILTFESLFCLQLRLGCYDSSNTAIPFTGRRQLFTYSFRQPESHPFLTPFPGATRAQTHFAWPLSWVFWERLLNSSLGPSSWAGKGGRLKPSEELDLNTLLKPSPFTPRSLNRAVRPAFSHARSRLHHHNATAH